MSFFSDNIKNLRISTKCKQSDLATTFDVTRTTMSDYERGKSEPSLDRLIKIADFFGISVDELIRSPIIIDSGSDISSANNSGRIGNIVANGYHVQQQVNTNTTEKDLSHKVALLEQEIQALKDKVADKDAHISSLREIIALYKK